MVFALLFLFGFCAAMLILGMVRRRRFIDLNWPSEMGYHSFGRSVIKYLSYHGWTIVKNDITLHIMIARKAGMDIQIRCEPNETFFTSTLIKDRSAEALQRRAEPLICITARKPPDYFQRTVGGGKVMFLHYKMLHIFASPKTDQAAVLEAMRIAQQEVVGSGDTATQSEA